MSQIDRETLIKNVSVLTDIKEEKLMDILNKGTIIDLLDRPKQFGLNEIEIKKLNEINSFITAYSILRKEEKQKIKIDSPTSAKELFQEFYRGQNDREKVALCLLNTRSEVIHLGFEFSGSLSSCNLHPREVVKKALELNAAGVILAHNHPSGHPNPSREDIAITQRMEKALDLVGIRLLDHIVLGDRESVSIKEEGLDIGIDRDLER